MIETEKMACRLIEHQPDPSFFLNLDKNLALIASEWGTWIYVLLFAVVIVVALK